MHADGIGEEEASWSAAGQEKAGQEELEIGEMFVLCSAIGVDMGIGCHSHQSCTRAMLLHVHTRVVGQCFRWDPDGNRQHQTQIERCSSRRLGSWNGAGVLHLKAPLHTILLLTLLFTWGDSVM
mmetsp:Transcript_37046/g.68358  ORF Transcript_37046/g.68358 Transcript_37046/m.68358 type:complete len:124 (-) Transcript_37046:249-620(-)